MNLAVSGAMALTVLAIVGEIVAGVTPWWIGWGSLALGFSAMGLAGARIVPNAKRLGRGGDPPEVQTRLARSIYREHLYCLGAMATVLALQLEGAL